MGGEGDGEGEYEELEGAKQSTVEPDEKEVEWGSDTRFLNSERFGPASRFLQPRLYR